jgi:hypothetical protein
MQTLPSKEEPVREVKIYIIAGYALYCFTSCFTVPSLLGMACILSFHASSVHHYWAWLALFHLLLHWSSITGHGWHCFASCFTGSSLLGMFYITSHHASPIHHYWA